MTKYTPLAHCLFWMSPYNHKRTTRSLAPPILQSKDRKGLQFLRPDNFGAKAYYMVSYWDLNCL